MIRTFLIIPLNLVLPKNDMEINWLACKNGHCTGNLGLGYYWGMSQTNDWRCPHQQSATVKVGGGGERTIQYLLQKTNYFGGRREKSRKGKRRRVQGRETRSALSPSRTSGVAVRVNSVPRFHVFPNPAILSV